MTGLEVPGFFIGLSGIVPIIEKPLVIWQGLLEAKGFGSYMMRCSSGQHSHNPYGKYPHEIDSQTSE